MQYETVHNVTIPKIGFGTWKIGGGSHADRSQDATSLAALRSTLELGYTHFDTAEMYAGGHAEELLGQALKDAHANRDKVFIVSKVTPTHLRYVDVLKACEASLRRLQMEYLDLYLIHWPNTGLKLADTFRALNKLVRDGNVHHLGVSNFNIRLLKESQALSETPLVMDQVPYSIADRSYAKNGVLEYCQQNDILFTAYSPLEVGRLKVNQVLRSMAEAHKATPYQIDLAWLIQQPRVITIPMSSNPSHQKENLEAINVKLTQVEMKELTQSA